MAQGDDSLGKVLASKTDSMSSIPGTQKVRGGELILHACHLTFVYVRQHTSDPSTHT